MFIPKATLDEWIATLLDCDLMEISGLGTILWEMQSLNLSTEDLICNLLEEIIKEYIQDVKEYYKEWVYRALYELRTNSVGDDDSSLGYQEGYVEYPQEYLYTQILSSLEAECEREGISYTDAMELIEHKIKLL